MLSPKRFIQPRAAGGPAEKPNLTNAANRTVAPDAAGTSDATVTVRSLGAHGRRSCGCRCRVYGQPLCCSRSIGSRFPPPPSLMSPEAQPRLARSRPASAAIETHTCGRRYSRRRSPVTVITARPAVSGRTIISAGTSGFEYPVMAFYRSTITSDINRLSDVAACYARTERTQRPQRLSRSARKWYVLVEMTLRAVTVRLVCKRRKLAIPSTSRAPVE